jgi:hypothetical protein
MTFLRPIRKPSGIGTWQFAEQLANTLSVYPLRL